MNLKMSGKPCHIYTFHTVFYMKKASIVLTALTLVFCLSCQQKTELQSKITISGQINQYADSMQPYLALNHPFKGQQVVNLHFDEDGRFSTTLSSELPINVYFVFEPFASMYVQPGDSLFLEIVPNDTVLFSGQNAVLQQQIARFHRELRHATAQWANPYEQMYVLPADSFVSLLNTRKIGSEAFLEAFMKNGNHDPLMEEYGSATIRDTYINHLAFFPLAQPQADAGPIQEALSANLAIVESDLNFPGLIRSILDAYMINFLRMDDTGDLLPPDEILNKLLSKDSLSLLDQLSVAKWLADDLQRLDTAQMNVYQERARQAITNEWTRRELFALYDSTVAQLARANTVNSSFLFGDSFSAIEMLDSLLAENQGKVVYVDIWATWCGPCISEFERLNSFKATLEGKPIAYVYLCAQSKSPDAWKALVNKYELNGHHVFLNDRQFRELDSVYTIEGFPTYFIFSPQGQLLHSGFDWRPSHPATLKEINAVLSEL